MAHREQMPGMKETSDSPSAAVSPPGGRPPACRAQTSTGQESGASPRLLATGSPASRPRDPIPRHFLTLWAKQLRQRSWLQPQSAHPSGGLHALPSSPGHSHSLHPSLPSCLRVTTACAICREHCCPPCTHAHTLFARSHHPPREGYSPGPLSGVKSLTPDRPSPLLW